MGHIQSHGDKNRNQLQKATFRPIYEKLFCYRFFKTLLKMVPLIFDMQAYNDDCVKLDAESLPSAIQFSPKTDELLIADDRGNITIIASDTKILHQWVGIPIYPDNMSQLQKCLDGELSLFIYFFLARTSQCYFISCMDE